MNLSRRNQKISGGGCGGLNGSNANVHRDRDARASVNAGDGPHILVLALLNVLSAFAVASAGGQAQWDERGNPERRGVSAPARRRAAVILRCADQEVHAALVFTGASICAGSTPCEAEERTDPGADHAVHHAELNAHSDAGPTAEVPPKLSESPYASFDNDPGEVARQLRHPLEGPLRFMAVESGDAVRIQRFDDPRPRRFFRFAGAGPPDQVRAVVAPADPDASDTKLATVASPQLEQTPTGGRHAAGESVARSSGQDHASARELRYHPLAKSRNGVRPQGAGLDVAHVAGRQRHMQEAGGGSGRCERPGSRRAVRHDFLHDASVVGAEHDRDYRLSVSSQ